MEKIIPENAILIPENANIVFEGLIYDVYHWQQKLFDGTEKTFEMLRRADTVTAICVVDNAVLVIDDLQPNRPPRISFPGGRVEKDDSNISDAVHREIREETGYSFENAKLLRVHQPFTKIEWFVHLLVAWGAKEKSEPSPDPGEKIIVSKLPFDVVKQNVLNGVGYLGESAEIFQNAQNVQDIIDLPEFAGKPVNR